MNPAAPAQYYLSGRLSQHLLLLACAVGIAGLLASRALVAIAPIAGVVAALANPSVRLEWSNYLRNRAALLAAAVPCFLLLSGFYTTEWAAWRHELFRDLVWLGVPLAFALAVPLTASQRLAVGSGFVGSAAAVGLATLGRYLLDPASANEAIRIGQNVPAITHVFHIPFGVMLALAFFWGLLLRGSPLAGRWLRGALLLATIGAALTLHVLAYRTGLLVFYSGLFAVAVRLLVRRRLLLGLAALVLMAAGPWLAYHALDSVQKRVDASIWDVQQFTQHHNINNYSLAQRLAAIETAGNIVGEHWLLGVGPADTQAAMQAQYQWQDLGLGPEKRTEVHNQYLQALLGGGLLGLGLLLGLVFWPLTRNWARREPAVGLFVLLQATAMLVDAVFDLQTGLNLFVFTYGFLVVAGERRYQERQLQPTNMVKAFDATAPF